MSTMQRRRIPELVNGDELTSDEFMRRYEAMPHVKKAELIEGVVYMGSPVRIDAHGDPHSLIVTLCGVYRLRTPGIMVGDNSTVRLDGKNVPQPDASLLVRPEFGGQARIVKGYVVGGPDFVAEVSASTTSIDLNKKLRAYQRHGVREYLVWRTEEGAIDWFVHDGKQFNRVEPDADGIVRSRALPGFWIDVRSLLADDGPKPLDTLEAGLASVEHAAFVEKLRHAHASSHP